MKHYGLYYNLSATQLLALVTSMDFTRLEARLAVATQDAFASIAPGVPPPAGLFAWPPRIPPFPAPRAPVGVERQPVAGERRPSGSKLARKAREGSLGLRW